MKYRYLSDCHVHSDCSPDANDPAIMLCERAEALGLYALTITDHCECNEYIAKGFDKSIHQSYFEARKAAAVFQGRLQVYAGMELGQPMQDTHAADDILNACDFDFVLASIHNIRDMEDFYFLDYNTVDAYDALDRYFEEMLEMIHWGKFDSLAHLTYPLRYIVGDHSVSLDFSRYNAKVDEVLKALIEGGKALELNTSGLRQKIGETLPSLPILKRYFELGGKYVTIGADSHRWADLGSGIEQGLSLLKQAGFQYFTIYVNRKPQLLPIE
jgi:histidinol-phosphatase (PHP family)